MADIRVETIGKSTFAHILGELTALEADDLNEALQEAVTGPNGRVAINLERLAMLDSTGLAALINLVNRSRLTGGRVVLVAPSPFVANILSVTRLDTWFDIVPSLADAETHLAR